MEMEEQEESTFHPDLIHRIFKRVWARKAYLKLKNVDAVDCEARVSKSKKNRLTYANSNALKLSCELLQIFISEAVQRAASIAEAEGADIIETTHFERILPQLLLDF